jgi:hypothetical protein
MSSGQDNLSLVLNLPRLGKRFVLSELSMVI